MSRETERMIELMNELASRAGHLLSDMVPPAAQVHLLNAQRELITALVMMYEHRMTGAPGGSGRRASAPRSRSRRPAKRTGKIPVD